MPWYPAPLAQKLLAKRRAVLGGIILGVSIDPPEGSGGKEKSKVQYLATQEYVDPGPLLAPGQFVGMLRSAVLPGHEALINLKSEGKIVAGGFPVGAGAIAFIVETDSPQELDSLLQEIPFWGIVKTKVTPLQDFEDRHDQDRQFTEQLEQSLQP